jgi:hypothetical protein
VSGDLNTTSTDANADRPEAPPLVPHCVGPSGYEGFDVVGPGVGGEVEIGVIVESADDCISYDPTHEIEAETSGMETGSERVRFIDEGL